jgi:hypothetical protein
MREYLILATWVGTRDPLSAFGAIMTDDRTRTVAPSATAYRVIIKRVKMD